MILWQLLIFFISYSFIKLFVLSDFVNGENDFNEYDENNVDSKDLVLDSVYDTMKHNYEVKLQQNIEKLNIISDLRNKRNTNEPMNANNMDFFKNYQYDVNRKVPGTYPLGFKNPPKIPLNTMPPAPLHRSDYYEEDIG